MENSKENVSNTVQEIFPIKETVPSTVCLVQQ